MQKYFTNNDEKTKYEDEIYNLDKDVFDYYKSNTFRHGISINIDLLYTLEEDEKNEKIEKIQAMENQFAEFMKRLNDLEKDVRRNLYGNLSSIDTKLNDIKEILFLNGILEKSPSINFYLKKIRDKLNPTKSDNSNGPTEAEDRQRRGLWPGGGKTRRKKNKKRRSSRRHKK